MKNFIIPAFFILSGSMVFGQMHSSVDVVGGYDFLNQVSGGALRPIGDFRKIQSVSGYRVGVNGNVRLFDKLVFKTGARFVRHSYLPYGDGSDNPLEDLEFFIYYYEAFHEYYIEFPIVFRYEVLKKRLGVFVEAGVSPNLYQFGKRKIFEDHYYNTGDGMLYADPENPITSEVEDLEIRHLQNTRVRMSYAFGVGVQYSLNRSYQIFVQPTLRYLPELKSSSITPSLLTIKSTLNVGVEIGIRRALRNERFNFVHPAMN